MDPKTPLSPEMACQMSFEIFLVTVPGMETTLANEARDHGLPATPVPGGAVFTGNWADVWNANLNLRGATRVLARIGSFRAFHLAQLDKRATKFDWTAILRPDVPVKVEVTTKASKIYHAKAAIQRIETALKSAGISTSPDAELVLKTRIDDNLVTFSIDTSGAPLHIRGHKSFVGKAPMRENLAALFLRQCGYSGSDPVVDPMCGSGTFPIEAAEIAAGLQPGRSRAFAFEQLASFDAAAFSAMKTANQPREVAHIFGSDRDAGAIKGARENAQRAGVNIAFKQHAVSDLERPNCAPGLVIINPPYGGRIGNKKLLYGLYGALGKTLLSRFSGWRVGLVTSEPGLAKATDLPFKPETTPISHGGIKITLFQTNALP